MSATIFVCIFLSTFLPFAPLFDVEYFLIGAGQPNGLNNWSLLTGAYMNQDFLRAI